MRSIEPNPRVSFAVRFASERVIVVEKPAGVVTQPGIGHEHDTLLNGLFAEFGAALQRLGRDRDFGLLHRLDRETSGLVAVALEPVAYHELRDAFAERRVRKHYWAVAHKPPREAAGVIRRAIAEEVRRKDKYTSQRLARLDRAGKPAVTAYRVVETSDSACLIEARPITGRLHQVRVHLDSIGAGILGDRLYGPTRTRGASRRLALHAFRLCLPLGGETIDVRSPMPRDLRRLLRLHEIRAPSASPRKDAPVSP